MLKLVILLAIAVGGFLVVRKILADDGGMEADSYYSPPEPAQS